MSGFVKTGLTFFGLGSGISLWAYVILFGVGVAAGGSGVGWVMHQHAVALTAQRDQFQQAASLSAQDAKRWHDASDLRDKSIDVLNATLSKQNAAIEASKLDQARLENVAASAEADRAKLQSDLDARTAALDAFAKANPGKVCRLSDEVRERAAKLFTN